MNPYTDHDDRITALIERVRGKTPLPPCEGACPVRKPLRMIDDLKINEDLQHVLDNENVKEVMLPVLNEKDARHLASLSKEYEWNRNPSIMINIVKID